METVDPVRGPQPIPKRGRLPQHLLPGLHEVMVLRSRSGQVLALPRGTPPTFGQRMSGNFIEAYYVDCDVHSRTFSASLPTGDIGIDIVADVDVEMCVDDCVQAVIDRRAAGYLGDQLTKWVQQHASRLTSGFKVHADGTLADLGGRVLAQLQTESMRLSFSGLKIRELRVRLRLADQEKVSAEGAAMLQSKLRAQRIRQTFAMLSDVLGPDAARIYAAMAVDHEGEIPGFLQRLQAEQHAASEHKFEVLISLLQGDSIEPHLKEQLLKDLAAVKLLPGMKQPEHELASALLAVGAAVPGDEPGGGG